MYCCVDVLFSYMFILLFMMYLVKWLLGCDISYMSRMLCSTFHRVCVFVLPGLLLRVPANRAFWSGCSSFMVGSLGVTYESIVTE